MLALATLSGTQLAFFSTGAAMIPVFMIGIGVTYRADLVFRQGIPTDAFGKRAGRAIALTVAYAVTVFMVVGEFSAIAALDNNSNAGDKSAYVLWALFVGTLLLFYGTVQAVLGQLRKSYETKPSTKLEPAKASDSAKEDAKPR